MTVVQAEQLRNGTCTELPIAVVDKYFFADAQTERFQFLTAKAICGRCAVQLACLTDALQTPAPDGGDIRGGESATSLQQLRSRMLAREGSPEVIALAAIEVQTRNGGLDRAWTLRRGNFANASTIELTESSAL